VAVLGQAHERCGRSEHDDGRVVDRGEGAWQDARGEQLGRQVLLVEVARQVVIPPRVITATGLGAGRVGEECL